MGRRDCAADRFAFNSHSTINEVRRGAGTPDVACVVRLCVSEPPAGTSGPWPGGILAHPAVRIMARTHAGGWECRSGQPGSQPLSVLAGVQALACFGNETTPKQAKACTPASHSSLG